MPVLERMIYIWFVGQERERLYLLGMGILGLDGGRGSVGGKLWILCVVVIGLL
jgi:hypothetical protein